MPGVVATSVGYTGGDAPSPTYRSVCAGDGHTEALKVEFDPTKVEYKDLLKKFWSEHSYSRNGKTQYKSAIWANNEEQRKLAEESKQELQLKGKQVATEIHDKKQWYDAEEYHQKYVRNSVEAEAPLCGRPFSVTESGGLDRVEGRALRCREHARSAKRKRSLHLLV